MRIEDEIKLYEGYAQKCLVEHYNYMGIVSYLKNKKEDKKKESK